jgi:hypothetical protein
MKKEFFPARKLSEAGFLGLKDEQDFLVLILSIQKFSKS